MSRPTDQPPPEPSGPAELPRAVAEYAEQLLLGTGLAATDALRLARGDMDAPPELGGLAEALRAGWSAGEDRR
jgi:hypothetical protein